MGVPKAIKESETSDPVLSIHSITSAIELSCEQEDHQNPAKIIVDSNPTTQISTDEHLLSSLLFVIPLPQPAKDYSAAPDAVSPVLLYTLPRSVYEKPPKNPETGKRPKEKIAKKISRGWNKSIQDGEDIKRGDYEFPSLTKRFFGTLIRWTAWTLRFITTCDDQMLARLPPIKKLGPLEIVYLGSPPSSNSNLSDTHGSETTCSTEEVEKRFLHDLFQANKKTEVRVVVSGLMLPFALAAEIIVPFVFEITLIYFLVQFRGWRKGKYLLKKHKKDAIPPPPTLNDLENGDVTMKKSPDGILEFKVLDLEICQDISELTYELCSKIDAHKFPVAQDDKKSSRVEINQDQVIEMTTRSSSADLQKTVGVDVTNHLPTLSRTDTKPAQIPNTSPSTTMPNTSPATTMPNTSPATTMPNTSPISPSITMELQLSNQTTIVQGLPQRIDENAQVTDVTDKRATENVPTPCPADESGMVDTQISSTKVTETATTKSNLADALPTLQKKNQPKYIANVEIAVGLIKFFNESMPPNVVARHELNERRVAQDLNRLLRRRAKEYVKSIKKTA